MSLAALSVPDAAYAHVSAFVAERGVAPGDPLTMPVERARRANAAYYAALSGPLPHVAEVVDQHVPGPAGSFRIRIIRPDMPHPVPVMLYCHGGGYALNGVDTHERLMRELARQGGFAVAGLDYSLAPEHRHPTQLHEALAALRWLERNGERFGLRRDFVLAGDSAGAHLALATALALRDQGERLPSALLLAYGMYAPMFDTPSHRLFGGGGHGLTSRRMTWFWRNFLPEGEADVLALPLLAELEGLPPSLVLAAELDCLRDDSIALAARLDRAGVAVRFVTAAGMRHSFLQFSRFLPRASQAIAEMAAFARCRLDRAA